MRSQLTKSEQNYGLYNQIPHCYPFVKWAGGKGQLVSKIGQFIPRTFNGYFEPFLGGGAMFYYLVSNRNLKFNALLSDANNELINAYNVIKNSVESLIEILAIHQKGYRNSPLKYYYQLRAIIRPVSNVESAARFIALNKTCYNGLYRVNSKGIFNVPMGRYKNPLICDAQNLRNISLILNNPDVHLRMADYQNVLMEVTKEGDFIYLDPPYSPVSSTANFTGYTNTGFSNKDQEELAAIFKKLDKRGCRILLSNSNTPLIKKLYREYETLEIQANRAINSEATKRTGHTELLVRNYD